MYIHINGISVAAIIGCYDYERLHNQGLIIDVSVKLYEYNWIKQDLLDTTVDYDQLIDYTASLIPTTHYHLLESLAQFLASKILERFLLIKEVKITLTKPAICGIKAREIKVEFSRKRKFRVALALGSNSEFLPQQQLITAIEILGEYLDGIAIGGFYETKPVGYTEQANFYNTAITAYTNLKPEELLGKIKSIEKLMGKTEIIENGPRIIDIDLILVDDLVYTHNFLSVPHKRAHLRDFVLRPLADIAPEWLYPGLNKTIHELSQELVSDESSILKQVDYYKAN